MNNRDDNLFAITIDYDKSTPNPERVFMVMSNILTSLKKLDHSLIQSIDSKIEPVMMLEDIEASSLKAWVRQIIEGIDDDALKNLDWKPQVGKYLVRGKYIFLNFLKGRGRITDAKEIKELQDELYKAAEDTGVNKFPIYTAMPTPKIIDNIERLNSAVEPLTPRESVSFSSKEGDTGFNLDFKFEPEEIENMLTKETVDNTVQMILKVKKPDYLGSSQWEFKHDTRTIPAKITHTEWLTSFQKRQVDVRPGDSIRARVKVSVKYGHDMNVIATNYEVVEVIKIIADNTQTEELFT